MKKIISLVLIGIIIFSVLIFAKPTITDEGAKYKLDYTIKKGWNILPSHSSTLWDIDPQSAENLGSKIKATYLYLPVGDKYISTLGGVANQEDLDKNGEFLILGAAWYYIYEDTAVTFRLPKSHGPVKLSKGWNLFAAPPQMTMGDKKLGFGDCVAEKVYVWNNEKNTWEMLPRVEDLQDPDAAGLSVAIKMKETCTLGTKAQETAVIPELPGLPT